MTEPENHTLVLLREMRAVIDAYQEENRTRFDQLEKRLDGMHANGVKALAQFVGHRAMVGRSMGSFDGEIGTLKRRVDPLEAARP